jgi:hypothetical protein
MIANLRGILRSKSLISKNHFCFSSQYVCELIDEKYDDKMVELLTNKHKNLIIPKMKNEIAIINKVDEEVFPEIKTLYQGFTSKLQRSIIYKN